MAMSKYSFLLLCTTILCLSFLLLFFGRCNLFADGISSHTLSNRKLLATKFDFTPFLHHHKHHHQRHRSVDDNVHRPEHSGNEIDPRYGVEKRLVPSGPNPLHH
ncbi:CLAVATA3/ESR (CLE)-related protein 12 [Hibiscus syriacus]|uniref:CLAVATA3/ESR (CLE)-related protein 12 n=1 Tax=Hibiscus syriacus TaxID=106335 RepID=A0A6A2ZQE1_HIBSY|nr:CLAVATA3/ESR (CLE)-related protein 12-like [Hibiscus syriacus]KAE8694231.1 CLAVATA3/ESR (CLE)-related protein 12 [Hibiscus syriacus]